MRPIKNPQETTTGRRSDGGWEIPQNISSNRYHFHLGGFSLCGKWQSQATPPQPPEKRLPIGHMDCKRCRELWKGLEA